ncbi:MAG TPA: hypothetical protein VJ327_09390 [Patescibacteria group bacterium]|nr:hypothetical protein [Patescibacteria group bacterium]
MYSKLLQEFVDSRKPAEVVFTAVQIAKLAKKAGLDVFQYGDNTDELSQGLQPGEFAVVSFGQESEKPLRVETNQMRRYASYSRFAEEARVHWSISVEGATLTFVPYLSGNGGGSWGDATDPNPLLLTVAGIKEITYELPKPVVTLPLPPWNNSYALDWGSGMVTDSLVCFKSEAAAHVLPFIEKLQKLLE